MNGPAGANEAPVEAGPDGPVATPGLRGSSRSLRPTAGDGSRSAHTGLAQALLKVALHGSARARRLCFRPWLLRTTAGGGAPRITSSDEATKAPAERASHVPASPAPARRPRFRFSFPLAGALAVALLAAFSVPAHAATGGTTLLVNQVLDNVITWLSGPLAVTLGTIALVGAGFVWMFLRHERGADFAFRALLGAAIAIGAAGMVDNFLGSGALL